MPTNPITTKSPSHRICHYTLVIQNGLLKGRKFPVPSSGLTLGRSSKCDISIKDLLLSRTHCRFELRDAALWLIDLNSANQTLLNKNPVETAQLTSGDIITVGETSIYVESTIKHATSPKPPIVIKKVYPIKISCLRKRITWILFAFISSILLILAINLGNISEVKNYLLDYRAHLNTTLQINHKVQISPASGNINDAVITNNIFLPLTNSSSLVQPTSDNALTKLHPPDPAHNSPRTGVLRIISTPPKASVSIQNVLLGETPCELLKIMPGTHSVQITKTGYEPVTRQITLKSGETITEIFELVQTVGRIELVTAPSSATVLLNGKQVGVTTLRDQKKVFSNVLSLDQVPTGEHEVEVLHKGFAISRRKIFVKPDETLRLQFKLVSQFTPNYEVFTTRSYYRGILEFINEDGVRLETAAGVSQTILHQHILKHGTLTEPE